MIRLHTGPPRRGLRPRRFAVRLCACALFALALPAAAGALAGTSSAASSTETVPAPTATTTAPQPAAGTTTTTTVTGGRVVVAHPGGGSSGISNTAIAGAALAALIALGCLAWGVARMLAYEPHWTLSLRHVMAEAGFRASATWAEFSDWIRLGH